MQVVFLYSVTYMNCNVNKKKILSLTQILNYLSNLVATLTGTYLTQVGNQNLIQKNTKKNSRTNRTWI